jgi:hypothetical protein
MKSKIEKVAVVVGIDGTAIDVLSGMDMPSIGIGVTENGARVTFDRRIRQVSLIDTGHVETVVTRGRKYLVVPTAIELGVPPISDIPVAGIRLRFKDLKGESRTIYGLKRGG